MKILIATGVRRVREAGAAGVVFNHAEELQKRGHQVETWFFDDILQPPRWPARFQQLEFAFAVSRRIHKSPAQFDVANIHAPCGCVYGLSRKLFSSAALPPYVFTLQGSEERFVQAMRLEHRKGRTSNFSFRNRVWHRVYHQTMYDFSLSTADFGAVSDREGWIMSELKYHHPPGRVWYIPNGTTPEFFQPHSFTDSPANRLLFVGTWIDRKGTYYLVDSFAQLAPRFPQLSLTIAGCMVPEDQVKADFPSDLRPRVTVLPFLTRDAMRGLYASHDMFVFPSLVEGMPLTLVEAMASAMPVVTTISSGMADIVENGFNGLLVPAADSSALASAILRLYDDAALRKNLGLAAQETARRYTWDAIAAQMEHVLTLAVRARNVASAT
jgi:glycosyltransferase involved in cell wall biosynthesis